MGKIRHEAHDGIYGFIEFNNLEKELIDSAPFQRLRSIHQLAMCFQVYPGATHKRFEHSLGVMEMASRIFDRVIDCRQEDRVYDRVKEELQPNRINHWRQVLRIAALLHDVGHLPFSHAAEEELLPEDWNHERLTAEIIRHSEISDVLQRATPSIKPDDVVDLAWDVRKRAKVEKGFVLSPWKTLLNEILTGNIFGADRIDYLLRDSWHAGVAYGKFDSIRLVDGLRTVMDPNQEEITLGLELGSIHAAEALLVARYFMYTQVYFHDVRRAYDLHLKEFLKATLLGGKFPSDWRELLTVTDHEILAALREVATNPNHPYHNLASPLMKRKHFRTIYEHTYTAKRKRPTIFEDLAKFACEAFGGASVRTDRYGPKAERNDFWVLTENGSLESSLEVSGIIAGLPPLEFGFLFVAPALQETAKSRIDTKLKELLAE